MKRIFDLLGTYVKYVGMILALIYAFLMFSIIFIILSMGILVPFAEIFILIAKTIISIFSSGLANWLCPTNEVFDLGIKELIISLSHLAALISTLSPILGALAMYGDKVYESENVES